MELIFYGLYQFFAKELFCLGLEKKEDDVRTRGGLGSFCEIVNCSLSAPTDSSKNQSITLSRRKVVHLQTYYHHQAFTKVVDFGAQYVQGRVGL